MKKVLIISPSFPPVNAADMHRVRQSLPYFKEYGWEPVVVVVEPDYIEASKDELLLQTVPQDIEIIKIKALSTKYTKKLGLGSLALRSLWFYYAKVNQLLKKRKFDLIYFSTTMFPLPILGRVWKKKFEVPYVIDMQDPWLTDYYLQKPKHERPPKFWFSYRLNQLTEPFAMKKADGIIAVSEAYNLILQDRYKNIKPDNCTTLTFGAFEKDFDVLNKIKIPNLFFDPEDGLIHIPYIGRAGHDMQFSITCIFQALQKGLNENPGLFQKIRMYFIGTSYAASGKGKKTVEPIAEAFAVSKYVNESTDRIPYFQALRLLKDASMLLVPGSDDPKYTASKLYNYILARKPMLAVFHEASSVNAILQVTGAGIPLAFSEVNAVNVACTAEKIYQGWYNMLLKLPFSPDTDWQAFQPYTAREMTKKQTMHFEKKLKL
ncbi:hypothetical protein OKW21_003615 [Catalinimonas alkaloidigena]|uniref:glycosyltransferase n=1 Tax=Catalinimonas alkaloidigena TaxID=1075417 RepID=UPI002406BF7A|nr:glycosyltransferase [Catalinimonas alkaloidigena]MDF9798352.1 hypothetical protein [Catalinimonas alkaloidigena]